MNGPVACIHGKRAAVGVGIDVNAEVSVTVLVLVGVWDGVRVPVADEVCDKATVGGFSEKAVVTSAVDAGEQEDIMQMSNME
jgi:hypothetical protein